MRKGLLKIVLLLLVAPGAAFAACVNPAGDEGEVVYNGTHKVVQFCNGNNWISAGSSTDLSSLNADNLTSGTVDPARMGGGTANATTFLRGDGTWAAPSASITADSLDFSDMKDALTLDATTSVAMGSYDLNFDGNTLFIDASLNRVGIGTTAPDAHFHVAGHIQASGTNPRYIFRSDDANTSDRVIDLLNTGGSAALRIYKQAKGTDTTLSYLAIDTAGKMGLGTETPTEKLEVVGTVKATAFVGDGSGLTNVGGGITGQTTQSCTSNNSCTVSCPAGYFRSGCSATAAGTRTPHAEPSGANACFCFSPNGNVTCYVYCIN